MSTVDKIEKLAALKQSGAITEEEFQAQKQILLSLNETPTGESKDQMIYVLLAFFLGGFGVHNFYAGYTKKGIAQLLMTLLSPLTGGLLLIGVGIWVIVNIFAVNCDARGIPFKPARTLKIVLGIIMSILLFLWGVFIIVIGAIVGYTLFMNRYRANEILSTASIVALEAIVQDNSNVSNADMNIPNPEGTTGITSTAHGVVTINFDSVGTGAISELVGDLSGQRVVGTCDSTSDSCRLDMRK